MTVGKRSRTVCCDRECWLDSKRSSVHCRFVVIVLDTLRAALEHGYVINAYCRACDRHAFLDLNALIAAGRGQRKIVGLSVRCQKCRGQGEISLIWPGGL